MPNLGQTSLESLNLSDCYQKSQQSQQEPQRRKLRWTKEEDQKLLEAVSKYGPHNWGLISKLIGTRTGKQCRERWIIHHDPSYNRDEWSKEEDQLLIDLQSKYGNKWSVIAKNMNSRSTTNIKN